jgi:hypothetical protein
MSLPLSWVDRIFERCTLRYGHDFLRRWEGFDMKNVKADWANEMGGLQSQPEAIQFALDNLPMRAPTVTEFIDICNRAPVYVNGRLPPPKADKKVAEEAVKRLGGLHIGARDHKAWAHALRDREINHGGFLAAAPGVPEKAMTTFQRKAWREALDVKPARGDDE